MAVGREGYDEKRIGDHTFRVRMLDPETSEDLFLDLVKQAGPALAAFLSESEGGINGLLEQSVGSPSVLAAVRELVDRLDKETYRRMCRVLSEVSQVRVGDDKWPMLPSVESEVFRGRIMLRLKWLWFALGVQYAGFFDDLGDAESLLALARRPAEESS